MKYLLLLLSLLFSISANAQQVAMSTYIGGNGAGWVRDIAIDSNNNTYIVGGIKSTDLPTTPGAAQRTFGGYEDAFCIKLDAQNNIVWATYLGGIYMDRAYAVELDSSGGVILAGRAGAGFPVTPGAVQTQFKGGQTSGSVYPHPQDGFVAKLDGTTGAKVWATYFGANDKHSAIVRDIAVDKSTNAIYLAASNNAGTFTTVVADAFKRGAKSTRTGGFDGVLAKLRADGSYLEWATFIGGTADESPTPSVRVDSSGNPIYLTWSKSTNAPTTTGVFDRTFNGVTDWYVVKYTTNGAVLWATYVGGNGDESIETHNLSVRVNTDIVIAGRTTSTNLPIPVVSFDRTFNGAGDCGIIILNNSGSSIVSGGYLGGNDGEMCEGVDVDENNYVYVSGRTYSTNFPSNNNLVTAPSAFVGMFTPNLDTNLFTTFWTSTNPTVARTITVRNPFHISFGGETKGTGFPLVNPIPFNVNSEVHGFYVDMVLH